MNIKNMKDKTCFGYDDDDKFRENKGANYQQKGKYALICLMTELASGWQCLIRAHQT